MGLHFERAELLSSRTAVENEDTLLMADRCNYSFKERKSTANTLLWPCSNRSIPISFGLWHRLDPVTGTDGCETQTQATSDSAVEVSYGEICYLDTRGASETRPSRMDAQHRWW